MFAPICHNLPLTTIRRPRLLREPRSAVSKVVVMKGQKVGAFDTVAESAFAPEHFLLDVAHGLGLPAEQADEQIVCKVGDQVNEADIIAGPVGLSRRIIRAPFNARVMLTGSGMVLLEVQGQPYELKAGFPGEVVELIEERGVMLQTVGALTQGVWGNGKNDYGLLINLAKNPNHILTADRLEVGLRGYIILAGYCAEEEVFKAAANLPIRGLILSGMDPTLVRMAKRAPYPIILLDGFGSSPINQAAFKLLSTHEKREAAILAEPWDTYAGTRPEVIIPLPAGDEIQPPVDSDQFRSGQKVRLTRAPYRGKFGVLDEVMGLGTLPSGIRTLVAAVQLEDGAHVETPLANLEVLE